MIPCVRNAARTDSHHPARITVRFLTIRLLMNRNHMAIPLRNFGKTGIQISALGLGGHHLGGAQDEKTDLEIVHRALDGGITFYDNAWEYYRGKTESWLGLGLKGRREQAFIMTKVCTHGRDGSIA